MRPDPARRWNLKRVFGFGAACAGLVALGALALGAAAMVRLSAARTVLVDQVAPAVLAAQDAVEQDG